MFVNVIISTYSLDRYDILMKLLHGLSRQTYRLYDVTIIVDENEELYKKIDNLKNLYDNVNVVFNSTNKGLSYSRNVGINCTSGKILAFIDDDAIPDQKWLEEIVQTFSESEGIGAVVGEIFPLWENDGLKWFPRELYWMISCSYTLTPTKKVEVTRGFGVNMAVRRDLLSRIGIFNTNLGINGQKWLGGDDTEIFLRILSADYKIIHNPMAIVHHEVRSGRIALRNVIKRSFNGGMSVAYLNIFSNYRLNSSTESKFMVKILTNFYPHSIFNFLTSWSVVHVRRIVYVTCVLLSELTGYVYGTVHFVLTK